MGDVYVLQCCRILLVLTCVLGCLTPLAADAGANDDAGKKFFETKIRPLLAEQCYRCHGPKKQESELRLDSYEGLIEGGAAGVSIVPNEPDESLLLTAIKYVDDDLQMPSATTP